MTETKGWLVVHDIHIIPEDDAVPHTESPDCICGPTIEPREVDDHTAYVITHHSLDNREATE